MMQNLWWAAGYNIVAIPLAAGVLGRRGIVTKLLLTVLATIILLVHT